MKLEWNVYYIDFNKRCVTTLNIFNHSRFYKEIAELATSGCTEAEFKVELKSALMYNFWSKFEYEICIDTLLDNHTDFKSEKVDIYNQVMLNWEVFADYVWRNKNEFTADI